MGRASDYVSVCVHASCLRHLQHAINTVDEWKTEAFVHRNDTDTVVILLCACWRGRKKCRYMNTAHTFESAFYVADGHY